MRARTSNDRLGWWWTLAAVALLLLTPVGTSLAEEPGVFEGRLSEEDDQLDAGEYFDLYEFELEVGQRLEVSLVGDGFDPYLAVVSPSGEDWQNDDWEGDLNSRIELDVTEAGTWTVMATSFSPRSTGSYELTVEVSGSAQAQPQPAAPNLVEAEPVTLLDESARLGDGSELGVRGTYYDTWTIDVEAGQELRIEMTSTELDCYLVVIEPDGERWDDDDGFSADRTDSALDFVVDSSGVLTIYTTTFNDRETGSYQILAQLIPEPTPVGPTVVEDLALNIEGELEKNDPATDDGRLYEEHGFEAEVGDELVVVMTSESFDTYLTLISPSGRQWSNDDHHGRIDMSQIEAQADETGTYTVLASSYSEREVGPFYLEVTRLTTVAPEVVPEPAPSGALSFSGELDRSDRQLEGRGYTETHAFPGFTGQVAEVTLESADFDTYLIVTGPSGAEWSNDDDRGSIRRSSVTFTLPETGTYEVSVTSYGRSETGAYTLDIVLSDAGDSSAPPADESIAAKPARRLEPGQLFEDSLDASDAVLEDGSYVDEYVFEGEPGDRLRVEMRSDEIDTFLAMVMPDGRVVQNDDFQDSTSVSRIVVELDEAGEYRLMATSYSAGETGSYRVRIEPDPWVAPAEPRGPSRVFGVFVGVADYAGDHNDLPHCDTDAVRARSAALRQMGAAASDTRLLLNEQATVTAMSLAIRDMARQMGPDDLLVVFYSGHGSQVRRHAGADAQDPDGLDETLALYDGDLTDDRLSELLDDVKQGQVLFVIDACHAGGFQKDVIDRPGRMGFFSSREEVLSSTAGELEAGGYLARFYADALLTDHRLVDTNADRAISPIELSLYLHERYRQTVREPLKINRARSADVYKDGLMEHLGYQTLVVDLGGVDPLSVLMAW